MHAQVMGLQEDVYSAVFIDMPNVRPKEGKINWNVLAQHIQKNELVGTLPIHLGAYASYYGQSVATLNSFNQLRLIIKDAGFGVYERIGKDIDSWIMNDIWMSINRVQIELIAEQGCLTLPLSIKHILLSGDGGYLRSYHSLYDTFGNDIDIELVVYSWKDLLHGDLEKYASKVVYLDDLDLVKKPL